MDCMTYEQAIIYYKSLFVCYNPATHPTKHSIIAINVCERLSIYGLFQSNLFHTPLSFSISLYVLFTTLLYVVLNCMT